MAELSASISKTHLKAQVNGHLRRAQERVQKAMKGSTSEDRIIQAALGAVCVGLALRLLRVTPVSKLVASIGPMVAFAALYSRERRGSRS